MHCPYCGTEVKEGWVFCPNCAKNISTGEPVSKVDPDKDPVNEPAKKIQDGPKSGAANAIAGLIVVALFVGGFLAFAVPHDNKPNTSATTAGAATTQQSKMEVKEGWKWKVDNYGFSRITGSVENTGKTAVNYFEVRAEFLDENGKVVDTTYCNSAERVEPGAQKTFEMMHKYNSKFKSARLKVENVKVY